MEALKRPLRLRLAKQKCTKAQAPTSTRVEEFLDTNFLENPTFADVVALRVAGHELLWKLCSWKCVFVGIAGQELFFQKTHKSPIPKSPNLSFRGSGGTRLRQKSSSRRLKVFTSGTHELPCRLVTRRRVGCGPQKFDKHDSTSL